MLPSSPLLLPNPNLPYHLYTDEKGGIAFRAVIQPAGPKMLPVAFISKQTPLPGDGSPAYMPWQQQLLYTQLKKKKKRLILDQPLTIFSPHRLADLLASKFLSDLSDSQLQQFTITKTLLPPTNE